MYYRLRVKLTHAFSIFSLFCCKMEIGDYEDVLLGKLINLSGHVTPSVLR